MQEHIGLIILIAVIVIPVLWIIITYNNLVKLRQCCLNAWSQIDTELKRRYDLIPNLVDTVKGYAKYESGVLQNVTEARAKAVASTGKGQQPHDITKGFPLNASICAISLTFLPNSSSHLAIQYQ